MNSRFFCLFAFFVLILGCSKNVLPTEADFSQGSPKNIILMIGDGMGMSHLSALMYQQPGSVFEEFQVVGFQKTHATDQLITDSAASATAMATGVKTFKMAIGVDRDTMPLKSILEFFHEKSALTGIVTTASLTHATPASFYAHQSSRAFVEAIAKDLLDAHVDILIGGGKKNFDESRTDRTSLIPELRKLNYAVNDYTKVRLNALPVKRSKKIIYFTDLSEPNLKLLGHYHLTDAISKTFAFFKAQKEKGFFLMVEGAQIDWAAHANLEVNLMNRLRSFEEAVKTSLKFARGNKETLLIVTADHETGGVFIEENSKLREVKVGFRTKDHTSTMVPVLAYGPSAELFKGIYDNTEIFHKIMAAMKWDNEKIPSDFISED